MRKNDDNDYDGGGGGGNGNGDRNENRSGRRIRGERIERNDGASERANERTNR